VVKNRCREAEAIKLTNKTDIIASSLHCPADPLWIKRRRGHKRAQKVVGALVATCLVSALLPGSVHAAKLYRYKDDNKRWVIASSVPSERVKNGYEVVDETGRVIDTIDPQRSPAEARAYIAQLEAKQEREEAVRRINLLYGSEADIDSALKKALLSIDNSMANTTANVRQLKAQRQRLETQAARIQRAGNTLSDDMVTNIATLGEQIENLQLEMDQRAKQKDIERERHARDRVLFREVHGITRSDAPTDDPVSEDA